MRVHDRSMNKKDQGSVDRGIIYIDFQAGMFEALKLNFLQCIADDYGIIPFAPPKIELFDQAEERIVKGIQHDVKVKVHNTKCSLDVQGFHDYSKKFEHLDNRTVGLYFAEVIVAQVVEKINTTVDITKLNDHLRLLANEGRKSVKQKAKVSSTCKVCDKDFKTLKTDHCSSCKEKVHSTCLVATTLICGACKIYPDTRQISHEAVGEDINIETLKKNVLLPIPHNKESSPPSAAADIVSNEVLISPLVPETEKLDNITKTDFKCDECSMNFNTSNELKHHYEENHDQRGAKRQRQETSLLSDPVRPCLSCDEMVLKVKRSHEEHKLTQAAHDEVKALLDVKVTEVKEMSEKLSNLRAELLKLQAQKPTSAEEIVLVKEENALFKQMIVDKDSIIKKLKETHSKQLIQLEMEKKAAEEAIGNATSENTKMREKETILLNIFKSMKQLIKIDEQKEDGATASIMQDASL